MLKIHDDKYNRFLYVVDSNESLRRFIENYAKRDWYDWIDDYIDDETGETINHRYSYCTEIFIPDRQYKDVVMYLNFPKYKRLKYSRLEIWRTIVHETVHASDAILDGAGVAINRENEEARAYQTDWLFGKIMQWVESRWSIT